MMTLLNLLEGFKDGQDILVRLKNGDEFNLYDFEIVDESIYDRNDLVMATIRHVVFSKFHYRNGTKLEFVLSDVLALTDPVTGVNYFETKK